VKVGLGFDAHRFSEDPGRVLRLGGITLEGPGLEGHSDGDVVVHALVDAILGALGEGDMGRHFGEDREEFRGAESRTFLEYALGLVAQKGSRLVSADVVIVCERPRLAGSQTRISEHLSRLSGCRVNVKAKRPEALFARPADGIACLAIALLE
jgi:2-C-methyl-D-erythritol 2,4-cyclodiphosphate synthase